MIHYATRYVSPRSRPLTKDENIIRVVFRQFHRLPILMLTPSREGKRPTRWLVLPTAGGRPEATIG